MAKHHRLTQSSRCSLHFSASTHSAFQSNTSDFGSRVPSRIDEWRRVDYTLWVIKTCHFITTITLVPFGRFFTVLVLLEILMSALQSHIIYLIA